MPQRIFAAVATAWDAASMDSTIVGGLWFNSAPTNQAYPHCIMRCIGDYTQFFSTHGQYSNCLVEFQVFYRENNSTDPAGAVGLLVEQLDAVLGDQSLPLASGAGQLLALLEQSRNVEEFDEDERLYLGTITYVAKRRRTRRQAS